MTDSRQRFLIVRLSSIGDIVHTLPAVAALSTTFPQAEIHWAVESRHALLLDGNPHVHRVVELDTLGWRKRLTSASTLREIRGELSALRACEYDAAIDFQGLWKSSVVALLSGAPQRIGFEREWLREPTAAVLYTQRVRPGERQHVIEMNLSLVRRLGAQALPWQFPLPRADADDAYVEGQLAALDLKDFIVMNPGGGWRSKCWAPENYAELIRRLEDSISGGIVLTGSRDEEKLIGEILDAARIRRAVYMPTTLIHLIALVRRARLFIGGDTGPLHLAAAVGTPIVGIYGPTDPARNGPFHPDDIALSNQGPIDHTRRGANPAYLPGISVDSVMAAVTERLARVHG
jgi:lipopolysaccharide heptosyltransferase I